MGDSLEAAAVTVVTVDATVLLLGKAMLLHHKLMLLLYNDPKRP